LPTASGGRARRRAPLRRLVHGVRHRGESEAQGLRGALSDDEQVERPAGDPEARHRQRRGDDRMAGLLELPDPELVAPGIPGRLGESHDGPDPGRGDQGAAQGFAEQGHRAGPESHY